MKTLNGIVCAALAASALVSLSSSRSWAVERNCCMTTRMGAFDAALHGYRRALFHAIESFEAQVFESKPIDEVEAKLQRLIGASRELALDYDPGETARLTANLETIARQDLRVLRAAAAEPLDHPRALRHLQGLALRTGLPTGPEGAVLSGVPGIAGEAARLKPSARSRGACEIRELASRSLRCVAFIAEGRDEASLSGEQKVYLSNPFRDGGALEGAWQRPELAEWRGDASGRELKACSEALERLTGLLESYPAQEYSSRRAHRLDDPWKSAPFVRAALAYRRLPQEARAEIAAPAQWLQDEAYRESHATAAAHVDAAPVSVAVGR